MKRIVNTPLAETFGWLHVGGTTIELPDAVQKDQFRENQQSEEKPQRIGRQEIRSQENPSVEIKYELTEGETETVVLENDAPLVSVSAELAEGACLTLVQVRHVRDTKRTCADIRVECGKNAQFHWYRLILDGQESYDNCSAALVGEGSSFTADIGYRLDGDRKYDVNCEAIHLGRRTESAIRSSGVLADNAFKLLRGTIDFRNGCSGAVGNESEDVLLLTEDVHNQSVPVILCAEEDVVGNHGASIGRPDESLLYYMETRGIDADTALRMLSRAKLEAVINRIPDVDIVDKIREKYL